MKRKALTQNILMRTPKTVTEALDILQEIENIYDEVNKETRSRVEPHYTAIKQIHDELKPDTKGLWEKRTQTREALVTLMEKRYIKKPPVKGEKIIT